MTILQASKSIIIDPPGKLSVSLVFLDHKLWIEKLVFRIGTGLKTDLALSFRYLEDAPGNWDKILREYHQKN